MTEPDFKANVTSDVFWLRTIYTVIYFFVLKIMDFILIILVLTQWLLRLFTGKNNRSLQSFSWSLGVYYREVTHYLTGCSETKPFPFREWPERQD